MAAFYKNSLGGFLDEDSHKIVGILTQQSGLAGFQQQLHTQTLSWADEISILKKSITKLISENQTASKWGILLEYPIARRAKRIDAVILTDKVIVIEFKKGKTKYDAADKDQLIDYCLDLRDFHYQSKNKIIIPALLSEEAENNESKLSLVKDLVQETNYINSHTLTDFLVQVSDSVNEEALIDYNVWDASKYMPTPTIIEAAQVLFSSQSVEEISRSHADTKNLTKTTNAVVNAIKIAKENGEKIICFITGVPGAGKTLAGLNIAHHSEFQQHEKSLATFLSGNGPLIKVLREALTRDAVKRVKSTKQGTKKKEQERIIAFIENVHRFIDAYFFKKDEIPNNNIVIFDEAQRAWNAEHSKRKFNRDFSEPEMMLEIMDRHPDWAAVIALVGGGQEINTGEAGLREWGNNIVNKFSNWKVYISPELKQGDHSTGNLTLFETVPDKVSLVEDADLHLDVSIRSYKAQELSKWVHLVLSNEPHTAKQVFINSLTDYPIALTRNLDLAKAWLNRHSKGTRRMGLVASSGGRRLRAYGLDVKAELEEENWFLNDRSDVRSSFYLEVPATEFGIQGLELDWVGVCWDADLRRYQDNWEFKSFKGNHWRNVNGEEKKQYILNKYRVLLTRAREGMVIWIPEGDKEDQTRLPEFYDPIFEYLKSCGVPELI